MNNEKFYKQKVKKWFLKYLLYINVSITLKKADFTFYIFTKYCCTRYIYLEIGIKKVYGILYY